MCHRVPLSWNVLTRIAGNGRAIGNALRSYLELRGGRELCASDPVMLQIEVTERCNFQCDYCIAHNGSERKRPAGRPDMSPELFAQILERFPRTFYLQLFGQGEPLLLGDKLVDLVSTASRERRFVALVTNGSLCTPDRAQQLLDAGIGAITFSLDLCSPERMSAHRKHMDVGLVEENLRRLVELRDQARRRASVGVSAVLLSSTPSEEVEAAVRRLDQLGIDFLMVGPLASTKSYRSRYPEPLDHEITIERGWRKRIPRDTRCAIYTTPDSNFVHGRCIWAWSALYVNYDGSVSYCANNHRSRLEQVPEANSQIAPVLDPATRDHPRFVALRSDFSEGRRPAGCAGCQYLLNRSATRAIREESDEGARMLERTELGLRGV